MPDALEVEDVQISSPRLGHPNSESGEQELFFDIAIPVRNSSQETLHVISELRSLGYDPDTNTLSLGLSEPELDPEVNLDSLSAPALTAVPPDDSVILRVSVPLVIRRLTRELDVEETDISNLERVDCRVGYGDVAFDPDIEQAAERPPGNQLRQQLQAWQTIAEKTQEPTKGKAPRRRRRSRRPETE